MFTILLKKSLKPICTCGYVYANNYYLWFYFRWTSTKEEKEWKSVIPWRGSHVVWCSSSSLWSQSSVFARQWTVPGCAVWPPASRNTPWESSIMAVSTGYSGQWVHQALVQPLRPDPTLLWLSVSVQDSGQWIHQVLSLEPTTLSWLSVAVQNRGQWSHQVLVQTLCPDPIPSVQDIGQ